MNKQRQKTEEDIESTLGFVPSFYKAIPDSGLEAAWDFHSKFELEETILDQKTKQLIGLAVSSHIKCKYCIHYHTRGAAAAGATPEEMREAVLMGGGTVFFSNSLTGMQVDFDEFKRDVARVIEHLSAET